MPFIVFADGSANLPQSMLEGTKDRKPTQEILMILMRMPIMKVLKEAKLLKPAC